LLVILSKEEKDLRCLHKYKTQNPLLILMYFSELKVGEVVRLKNIDSERILIHINGSKRFNFLIAREMILSSSPICSLSSVIFRWS